MSYREPTSSPSSAASRSATKRLLKELDAWRTERRDEDGIERLGPRDDNDLFHWEAVVNGRRVGCGYDGELTQPFSNTTSSPDTLGDHRPTMLTPTRPGSSPDGRWLLDIAVPPSYPLQPPQLRFVTSVVHPNISLRDGEICLDLLKGAWTPAYSILECVRAVRMLLSCPETDSPLNIDVAALLRAGDLLGSRRLVEFWCSAEEGRYDGP